ncbi:hypothetical protein [Oceanobacillus halophilus]|uniref:Swt1-like HEPN domain-containing protein n=1 Tax=Oceanobacillus halophilus TaxID=930130 RepID=A0A494ZZE3_9BACI|nr:hypothetical protein [Oceanobacillus halophilus]RKQ32306.1 hypothetical protein D8M06_13070 [Oceanobacillus halophilus]
MHVEFMKEAYGLLYEIENLLREEIETIMIRKYGIGWMIKAPTLNKYKPLVKRDIHEFYLHELISLASSYDCINSSSASTLKKLRNITSIRNKIAHSKPIQQEEFYLLQEVYHELKGIFSHEQILV